MLGRGNWTRRGNVWGTTENTATQLKEDEDVCFLRSIYTRLCFSLTYAAAAHTVIILPCTHSHRSQKLLRGNRIFWSFLAVAVVYFSPSVMPFITSLSELSRLRAQQLIEMTFPNTHTHTHTPTHTHTHSHCTHKHWHKPFIRGYINTVDSRCSGACIIFHYFSSALKT